MIYNMALVKKHGQINLTLMANTEKVLNMEKVYIAMQMGVFTMENGLITK